MYVESRTLAVTLRYALKDMQRDMKLENITNIRQTVGKTGRRVIRFNHEIDIDMSGSDACDFRRLRTIYEVPS